MKKTVKSGVTVKDFFCAGFVIHRWWIYLVALLIVFTGEWPASWVVGSVFILCFEFAALRGAR
jgi:hypothetical protein